MKYWLHHPLALPTLRSEVVREAFEPLVYRGFSEPEASLDGTDRTFTLRRDGDEVVVSSEDMGSAKPYASWRQPDGTITDIEDNAAYPAHGLVHGSPWPLSLYHRWRLRPALQEEMDLRVRRLAEQAADLERTAARDRRRERRAV
ncbi:hypothetical protein [Rubrivirga sp. IMCC45206]|uniref:hypothetical protein n=1 Tax=Rubrivirga sp. IMCC45206 TaxID=3391614 RepID=UPI00398F9D53